VEKTFSRHADWALWVSISFFGAISLARQKKQKQQCAKKDHFYLKKL
jgi:hypothetical protein